VTARHFPAAGPADIFIKRAIHANVLNPGKCLHCKAEYSHGQMGRHLLKCTSEQAGRHREFVLQIRGTGMAGDKYWMFARAKRNARLSDLDGFLRDMWLECCGHLSQFEIGGQYYSAIEPEPYDDDEILPVTTAISKVLNVGDAFSYDYDFGTTSTLFLRLYAEQNRGSAMKSPVELLAQNDPIVPDCHVCGKPSTGVCSSCILVEPAFCCSGCKGRHDKGDCYVLPLVNSPRTGMCGYDGI